MNRVRSWKRVRTTHRVRLWKRVRTKKIGRATGRARRRMKRLNLNQKKFFVRKTQMRKNSKRIAMKEMISKSLKLLLKKALHQELLWMTVKMRLRLTRKLTALTRELWPLMMTPRRKLIRKGRGQKVKMYPRSQG